MVSGHDYVMDNTRLIEENLSYVKSLQTLTTDTSAFDERTLTIHASNLVTVVENSHEKKQAYADAALSVLESLPESEYVKSLKQRIKQEMG